MRKEECKNDESANRREKIAKCKSQMADRQTTECGCAGRYKEGAMMKRTRALVLSLGVVAMVVLGGCQSAEPTAPATDGGVEGAPVGVNDMDLLALGILELEGSGDAVTPEQASKMLPFWQMLASGGLRGDTESASVMKQIQDTLTAPQSTAITTMDLTSEDQQVWMEERGIELPEGGGSAQAADMTDEDRAAQREKVQNMSAEEREQARAELGVEGQQGGGGEVPGDGTDNKGPAGVRGGNVVVQALIDLLTERAAE
jgi:hypothetical protein